MNQRADGSSARLVMRREGNLRLVLNAALYRGMVCDHSFPTDWIQDAVRNSERDNACTGPECVKE